VARDFPRFREPRGELYGERKKSQIVAGDKYRVIVIPPENL
jgi:hypothetical protein